MSTNTDLQQSPRLSPILAAACAGAIGGLAIGAVEWSLGQTRATPSAAAWITAFFVVISALIGCLAAGMTALARRWARLDPLWLWAWIWSGAYALLLVNIVLLPRQAFTSAPSIALSAAALLLAGVTLRLLLASTRRLRALGESRTVRAAGAALLLAGIVLLAVVPLLQPRPDLRAFHQPRKPGDLNAVVILIDTLRADHVGSYGYPRAVTPHLDRFAAGGVRFASAWSSSSWTVPAVASLFSGLPLSRHGATTVDRPFTAEPTLAAEAREAGLITAGFSANYLVSELYGFERGFDLFVSERSGLTHPVVDLAAGTSLDKVFRRFSDPDRKATTQTLAWLDAHRDDHFFLYVQLYAPHRPYAPPAAWHKKLVDQDYSGIIYQGAEQGGSLPEDALRNVMQRYDAEIAYADSLAGEILEKIETLGLAQSTLAVVLSDHGEAFGEHGRWEHGKSLHAEETRIPLMVRMPGGAVGRVESEPVSLLDLHATLREALGFRGPAQPATVSLLASILRGEAVPSHPVISELLADDTSPHPETADAVVLGRHRLIRNITTGSLELFDRLSDPAESAPIEDAEIAAALAPRLADRWWMYEGTGTAARMQLSEEDLRRLKALGYIR